MGVAHKFHAALPRILALHKAGEVVLDDVAGRLAANGDTDAGGAVVRLDLNDDAAKG